METTHCLHRHGFIILFLVIFISSTSCYNSNIKSSYNARGIKIYSDRKRVLSSSKSGESSDQPKQYPVCVQEPGPSKMLPIVCGDKYVITEIKFADYGQPTGDCKTFRFKRGNCGAPATLRLIKKNCLGKKQCWFPVTDEMFGPTHCKGNVSFVFFGTCTKNFIILLLVMFLSSFSNRALKINGSFDARGTNLHSDLKRISNSKSGGGVPPRGKEYPLCGFNNPSEDGIIFAPFCDKGYVFSEIKFADYGQPIPGSSCEALKRGNCGAPATLRLVKENCLGKERCRIYITDEMFGPTHCKGPVTFAFSSVCKKT